VEGAALFTIPLGFLGHLTVTGPGLERFGSIAFKSWVSVQMAIVLASTTPFPDLLMAMRALRIPRLLVAIFGLMWRYLFVMADEAGRLMRARQARSGDAGRPGARVGGSVTWRARVTGGMAGNLFLRSFDRADRIYDAMKARGYDGEARTLAVPAIPAAQWAVLAAGLALLVALLGLAYLL
jgi:cobalt/nickel transport system permease protein